MTDDQGGDGAESEPEREPEPTGWRPEDAPRLHPLSYPGVWPAHSILLLDESGHVRLDLLPGCPVGDALVGRNGATLDQILQHHGRVPVAERVPVLAVGSNAAPSQVRWKFGSAETSLLVPLVEAEVNGLAVGLAASVGRGGTVPATPVFDPDVSATLFVQWLDQDQLARLDQTEPGYDRRTIGSGQVQIALPSGQMLDRCDVYVSRHGLLVDDAGPIPLGDQFIVVEDLLARSAELRELVGPSAEQWFARMGEPGLAERVRQQFMDEGWVSSRTAST